PGMFPHHGVSPLPARTGPTSREAGTTMFNPDQNPVSPFEERLRSWVPSARGLDRDRMLFEAGRAQGQESLRARTSARLWKLATAAALLLASGLGMAWHSERSQRRDLELAQTR